MNWPTPEVRTTTGSTNADVEALAAAGAPVGTCVIADEQQHGRGRLGREWVSPPKSGLWMSVFVAPSRPVAQWGWLPLIAGIAVVRAIEVTSHVLLSLKWPNDVMAPGSAGESGGKKLGGILAERIDQGAVIGIGVNISMDEVPVPTATTLAAIGVSVTRDALAKAVLESLESLLNQWEEQSLKDEYLGVCSTIGNPVRVVRSGHDDLVGTATGIDDDGHLVIDNSVVVAAGDVTHLLV